MVSMGEPQAPPGDLAASHFTPYCGQCGYCLEGLPGEGLCPECGAPHRTAQIIIAGWGSGGKETGLNAPPERATKLFLLFTGGMLLIAATDLLRGRIWDGVFYLIWFGVILAVGMYNRWRLTSDYPTGAHARIFPEGFAQRNLFGPCNLHPWNTAAGFTLEPVSSTRYLLRIASKTIWTVPVSIEFDCDASKAAWLTDVISRFRNLRP